MPDVLFFIEDRTIAADLRVTTLTLDPSSENESKIMKKLLLSLTLAGVCCNQASAQQYIPATGTSSGSIASAKHIGDGVRSIGDTDRYVPETIDNRPEAFKPKKTAAKQISYGDIIDTRIIAPAACGSYSKSKTTWFGAESLLWFSDSLNAPAIATTSAQGLLPVAGEPGVTTEFGGADGIGTGLLPGFRVSGGTYFGDCDQFGVGGRVYGIFTKENGFSGTSDGTTSLGVPFFNMGLNPPAADAYLVGFTAANGDPVSAGSLVASSELDMIGADGSLYLLLGKSDDHRVDMVAGYTYNRLKSSIGLDTQSTNLFTGDAIPDGTVFTTNDLFDTENVFHGAHLGVLSTVMHDRINFSTLARVSFGNMRQTSNIQGSTRSELGGAVTDNVGGIFAQQSNIGTYQRDDFAFLPELGLKLGYTPRENLEFTVGYTFLFWSTVALAGDQMDSSIDLTQVGGAAGTSPAANLVDSGFWMQGLDLGMSYSF